MKYCARWYEKYRRDRKPNLGFLNPGNKNMCRGAAVGWSPILQRE